MSKDPLQAIVASMPFAALIGLRVVEASKDKLVGEVTVKADKAALPMAAS